LKGAELTEHEREAVDAEVRDAWHKWRDGIPQEELQE